MMRWLWAAIVLSLLTVAVTGGGGILPGAFWPAATADESPGGLGRTIVLGFDGMDPELTEQWMADGTLPNLARLAQDGHYQPLPTTNPAQSPVAWSTFATGLNPGAHGIFDFLRLNSRSYTPEYSISYVEQPETVLRAFGYQLPLDEGQTRSRRVGTPFWIAAEREGRRSSILRVPVTYPADPVSRMLSGMGVPDLLGTQGTFTFYTTEQESEESEGGRIVTVAPTGDRVETTFDGPPHPLYEKPTPLTVPITIEPAGADRVKITLDGEEVELAEARWSDWVTVDFTFGGFMSVSGIVRLHLVETFPDLKLYVSPIQFDPRAPAGPISMPPDYASRLAERIGLFHTIGMPEETWSLNEERISDQAYLEMVETILAEREAMLFDALEQGDSELVTAVFVQTDRVSHMFWRGLDPQHALYDESDDVARSAIKWIYGEADRILGRVMAAMKPEDRLIVLSDHGFDSFRRSVHLNRWLADQGFLSVKPGQPASESLFTNVDWTKTKAFALGLNGIFLNLRAREALGIVRAEDAEALEQEIVDKLAGAVDPETGEPMVLTVYQGDEIYEGRQMGAAPDLVVGYAGGYRASWQTALGGVPEALVEDNDRKWSGDHCVEPSLVPGILFTSFQPEREIASIGEVPGLVRSSLGLTGTIDPELVKPSLGVFDIASPAFSWLDGLMSGWLPAVLRLLFWGIVAAVASMALYKVTSNQTKLAAIKAEIVVLRRQIAEFDGSFSEMWGLVGRNLGLAMRQLWVTLVPAIIASVPVIFLLVWVSNNFDSRLPAPGEQLKVEAYPSAGYELSPLHWRGGNGVVADGPGTWNVAWPADGSTMELVDSDDTVLLTLPPRAPVGVVHQRRWWNTLVGNPAGYLPSPGDVDAVEMELPSREYLPFGPDWLRGWIPLFFGVVIIVSLLLKFLWRLH
jgi:predicted AlkP superfamily phosphohydrolase/phosphomutase